MTKPRDLATLGGGFTQSGTGAVQRSVENKLKDTVSVKDFGAVGDGVADDTAAIQAAINAVNAKGGGTLYFPQGRYKLTATITLKPGVSILGERKGEWGAAPTPGVVFDRQFTTGHTFNSPNTQTISSVTYENFFIEGNKGGAGGTNGNGIYIANIYSSIFKNVWCKEAPSNGFHIGSGGSSFHNYFYNCYAYFSGGAGFLLLTDWARLIDCWADGNYIGVEFPAGGGAHSLIDRCHFEEWEYAAIAVRGNPAIGSNGLHTISNCKFFSRPYQQAWQGTGIVLESLSGASGASGNKIINNFFTYESTYGATKSGKRAIVIQSNGGSNNLIRGNTIANFDIGVDIGSTGSSRNQINDNMISGCNTGINNTSSHNRITNNYFTANVTDLIDTGTLAWVSGNDFGVATTLHATDYATNNNSGSVGTYTPNMSYSGGSTGITYSARAGRFEKHGKTVHCWIGIELSNKGTAGGVLRVDLPLPTATRAIGNVWFYQGGASVGSAPFCYTNESDHQLYFLLNQTVFIDNTHLTNNTGFSIYVCYQTL